MASEDTPNTKSIWSTYSPLAVRLDTAVDHRASPIASFRHEWTLDDQVSITLGANMHASGVRDMIHPWAGVTLRSDGDWALEITRYVSQRDNGLKRLSQ